MKMWGVQNVKFKTKYLYQYTSGKKTPRLNVFNNYTHSLIFSGVQKFHMFKTYLRLD